MQTLTYTRRIANRHSMGGSSKNCDVCRTASHLKLTWHARLRYPRVAFLWFVPFFKIDRENTHQNHQRFPRFAGKNINQERSTIFCEPWCFSWLFSDLRFHKSSRALAGGRTQPTRSPSLDDEKIFLGNSWCRRVRLLGTYSWISCGKRNNEAWFEETKTHWKTSGLVCRLVCRLVCHTFIV